MKTVTVGLPNGDTFVVEDVERIHSGDELTLYVRDGDGSLEEAAVFAEGRWAFYLLGEYA